MRYQIYFTDKTSFEKGWTVLEMLSSQLMGDMKLTKGTSGITCEFAAVVALEEIDDTIALMKTLKEMANKDIHWQLNANWWDNTDKEN